MKNFPDMIENPAVPEDTILLVREGQIVGRIANIGKPKAAETDLYYIQDTRTYCGNSVMWWRVGGNGYTSDLKHAWKVPATWRGRETDRLWPCSDIDAGATFEFDMQKLRELKPLEVRKA